MSDEPVSYTDKLKIVEAIYGKAEEFRVCCLHLHARGAQDVLIETIPIIKQALDAGIVWEFVAPSETVKDLSDHPFWLKVKRMMTDHGAWNNPYDIYLKMKETRP